VSGIFSGAQPEYAEHGIATFPIGGDKRPSITNYQRVGLPGSAVLAEKFGDATGLGFMTNARNGIAVLDVDSTDERIFADALNCYGDTPVKVQTGSRKFHALYQFSGERRRIRKAGEAPIDILGTGGFVIAPPSVTANGTYRFIEGGLDDFDRLPIMRGLGIDAYVKPPQQISGPTISEGVRNRELWARCMREARRVDSLDTLVRVARTLNDTYTPPLDEREVEDIVQSAWSYEQRGLNRFGRHGVWFETSVANDLITADQDLYILLSYLRANNAPDRQFMIADGLAETLGWGRKRLSAVRKRAMQSHVQMVKGASNYTGPALFKWQPS
jgi:Bifunctional DNA primase/polymerase, N-terminal/Primase C terminal 1 (PriCT-1)